MNTDRLAALIAHRTQPTPAVTPAPVSLEVRRHVAKVENQATFNTAGLPRGLRVW